jgi:hypothetical protein
VTEISIPSLSLSAALSKLGNTNGGVFKIKIMLMKGLGFVVIVLGLFSNVNFLEAGGRLQQSGKDLTVLRSKGGESVAEAYYQEVGRSQIGHGSEAYGMGLATLMISMGLGGSMILKKKE